MLNKNDTSYIMDMDVVQDTLFEHIGSDILSALNEKENEMTRMRSELYKMKKREEVLVMLVRGERIKVKLLEEKLELLSEETAEIFDANIVKEVEDIISFERNSEENENLDYFEQIDNNENKQLEAAEFLVSKNEHGKEAAGHSKFNKGADKVENSDKIEIFDGAKIVQDSCIKIEKNESKIRTHQDEFQNEQLKNEITTNAFEPKHDNLTNEILDELFEREDEKRRIFDETELEEICESKLVVVQENEEIMEGMKRKRERYSEVMLDINNTLTDKIKKIKTENMKTVGMKRKKGCESCRGCLAPNCSVCKYCLDKPRFGGSNRLKKKCVERQCETIL